LKLRLEQGQSQDYLKLQEIVRQEYEYRFLQVQKEC
jgi:hypothetical protein